MRTLSVALRNLIRNARRSMVTLLGIALGSVAVLLFGGYKANIDYSMLTAYVRTGGHLQIQHRDYFLYGSGNPTAYGIADYTGLMEKIKSDPVLRGMVTVVTPSLQFGGIAGNYTANVSRTVVGVGLEADQQALLRTWNEFDVKAETPPFALRGTSEDAAIVGLSLARVLHLCEGLGIVDCPRTDAPQNSDGAAIPDDLAALSLQESNAESKSASPTQAGGAGHKIELLASNPRGAPNVVALNVVKAESQGFKEFDEVYLLLHLKEAQRLIYGTSEPRVSSIIIQLRHTSMTAPAAARIESMLADWAPGQPLVARDYRFLNPFYVQSIQMFQTIFGFMFVLIGSIVMFAVSNTMNTSVVERTVEIGTLRAMGLRRAGIQRMFVTEGALLGTAGALLGLAVAIALSMVVNGLGLHWLPPGSSTPVPLGLSVWGETGLLLGTTCTLIVIATISAWWPAYRAGRLKVVDALRHV